MPTEQPSQVPASTIDPGADSNLLTVAAIFLRQWKIVALGVIAGLILALVYILIKPDVYTAHAVMVPSEEPGGASSLIAAQLPAGLAGLTGMGKPDRQNLITSILRSRTIADSIAAEVLDATAGELEREVFVRQLRKRSKIQVTAQGEFLIEVRDRDPERAAWIANQYASLVNRLSADIGRQALAVKRAFLERQLAEARDQLVMSEEALLLYQQQTEAPEIQEQSRQTVEAAAELQRAIFQKEIELVHLRRVATPDNPELRSAVAELNALRQQLARLTDASTRGSEVFVPLGASPELKVGSVRLLREYTKDEQIYLALTAALAETQLDVQSNVPVVALLDPATVPRAPSGIKKGVVVGLLLWLGLIGGLIAAACAEYVGRLTRDPASAPFFDAWSGVRQNVRRVVRR